MTAANKLHANSFEVLPTVHLRLFPGSAPSLLPFIRASRFLLRRLPRVRVGRRFQLLHQVFDGKRSLFDDGAEDAGADGAEEGPTGEKKTSAPGAPAADCCFCGSDPPTAADRTHSLVLAAALQKGPMKTRF